jgi:TonB family protein
MTRGLFLIAVVFLSGTSMAAPSWVTLTPDQVAKLTVRKLRIAYPEGARLSRITGEGFFKVRVQKSSGQVKRVEVIQTTGNNLLDAAAIKGLSECRFKPGVLRSIKEVNPHSSDPFASEDCLLKVPVGFVLGKNGVITKGRHKGQPVLESMSRDAQGH